MENGSYFYADGVYAADEDWDVAILKVSGRNMPFAALADRKLLDQIVPGDVVYALGAPEGLSNSISNGLVSAIRRESVDDLPVFQITAPISSGSSGGPLVDQYGNLIGLTTAQMVEGQNLNFATPASSISRALADAQAAFRSGEAPFDLSFSGDEANADFWEGEAFSSFNAGEYDSAAMYFILASLVDWGNPRYTYGVAASQIRDGDVDTGIEWMIMGFEHDRDAGYPVDALFHFYFSPADDELWAEIADHIAAEQRHSMTTELRGLNALTILALANDEIDLAIERGNLAIELAVDDDVVTNLISANVALAHGSLEAAHGYARTAFESYQPEMNERITILYAALEATLGDINLARKIISQGLEVIPTTNIQCQAFAIEALDGNWSGALDFYRYYRLDEYIFSTCFSHFPQAVETLINTERYAEADDLMKAVEPSDMDLAEYYELEGRVRYGMNKMEAAVESFTRAINEDPERILSYSGRAFAAGALKQTALLDRDLAWLEENGHEDIARMIRDYLAEEE